MAKKRTTKRPTNRDSKLQALVRKGLELMVDNDMEASLCDEGIKVFEELSAMVGLKSDYRVQAEFELVISGRSESSAVDALEKVDAIVLVDGTRLEVESFDGAMVLCREDRM